MLVKSNELTLTVSVDKNMAVSSVVTPSGGVDVAAIRQQCILTFCLNKPQES